MKTGLTLGKYAPLHRGHQHVTQTALAEMDRVIVLIYDSPEVTSVPLPARAAWIQKLYPQVEVLEAWDGVPVSATLARGGSLHQRIARVNQVLNASKK